MHMLMHTCAWPCKLCDAPARRRRVPSAPSSGPDSTPGREAAGAADDAALAVAACAAGVTAVATHDANTVAYAAADAACTVHTRPV